MKRYSLLIIVLLAVTCFSCRKEKTPGKTWAVYDRDGNGYDTVKIGTQFWLKQNLNTSHYKNGDPIPEITSQSLWDGLTTGAWCWYNNDSATYAATYGKLYNWYAVNDPRGLAPEGWHIPSESEWLLLRNTLGGPVVAGGFLKEAGTVHWLSPNTDATNSSRFTGLPGGYRLGGFGALGTGFFFWISTTPPAIRNTAIFYNMAQASLSNSYTKADGYSVRCIKN